MQASVWVVFFQFALAAYLLSLGFGLILGQKNGMKKVNRFWMKLARGVIRWILKTIGDIFRGLAKRV